MGHQAAAIAGECAQQLELGRGEMHPLTVTLDNVRGDVDLQSLRADDRFVDHAAGAPQDRLKAGEQLPGPNGLVT